MLRIKIKLFDIVLLFSLCGLPMTAWAEEGFISPSDLKAGLPKSKISSSSGHVSSSSQSVQPVYVFKNSAMEAGFKTQTRATELEIQKNPDAAVQKMEVRIFAESLLTYEEEIRGKPEQIGVCSCEMTVAESGTAEFKIETRLSFQYWGGKALNATKEVTLSGRKTNTFLSQPEMKQLRDNFVRSAASGVVSARTGLARPFAESFQSFFEKFIVELLGKNQELLIQVIEDYPLEKEKLRSERKPGLSKTENTSTTVEVPWSVGSSKSPVKEIIKPKSQIEDAWITPEIRREEKRERSIWASLHESGGTVKSKEASTEIRKILPSDSAVEQPLPPKKFVSKPSGDAASFKKETSNEVFGKKTETTLSKPAADLNFQKKEAVSTKETKPVSEKSFWERTQTAPEAPKAEPAGLKGAASASEEKSVKPTAPIQLPVLASDDLKLQTPKSKTDLAPSKKDLDFETMLKEIDKKPLALETAIKKEEVPAKGLVPTTQKKIPVTVTPEPVLPKETPKPEMGSEGLKSENEKDHGLMASKKELSPAPKRAISREVTTASPEEVKAKMSKPQGHDDLLKKFDDLFKETELDFKASLSKIETTSRESETPLKVEQAVKQDTQEDQQQAVLREPEGKSALIVSTRPAKGSPLEKEFLPSVLKPQDEALSQSPQKISSAPIQKGDDFPKSNKEMPDDELDEKTPYHRLLWEYEMQRLRREQVGEEDPSEYLACSNRMSDLKEKLRDLGYFSLSKDKKTEIQNDVLEQMSQNKVPKKIR